MKISVITTVLNGAETLEQAILSVHAQSHRPLEHIIIDGGSTDGSLEVVERHRDKISTLVSEPDEGLYHGMNKGIACATGDVVGFLNADDFYNNSTVLDRVAGIFNDASVDACYADLVYVSPDNPEKIVRYWTSRNYRPGLFEKGWMPAHPTFYVRRGVYETCGGFNTDYIFHADFEHTARLIAVNGINTHYQPETWVRMRIGGTTNRSLSNIVRGNLESYRACRTLGLKVTPMYFVTKFLMRVPQFFNRPA
jgi:glycosyltransferase involved in cell wall biosynthesis